MAFQMTGESCRLPQSFDPYNGQTFIKFPYRFCMSWEKWIAGLTITYLHRILDINRAISVFFADIKKQWWTLADEREFVMEIATDLWMRNLKDV